MADQTDVAVERLDGHLALIEIRRGPNNYFDAGLVAAIAGTVDDLENDDSCRAIVLASEGKNFCAGAQLAGRGEGGGGSSDPGELYAAAVRLFEGTKPIVAAVQGAAVGGGLGLALVADFRVASVESRFTANFSRLGFFPGFGLTFLLPRVVGEQAALELLYTGARIDGVRAFEIGLCDRLVEPSAIREEAENLARQIAISAPLAVRKIRQHLRGQLAAGVRAATARELQEQNALRQTADFGEGVRAMAERRLPRFEGR